MGTFVHSDYSLCFRQINILFNINKPTDGYKNTEMKRTEHKYPCRIRLTTNQLNVFLLCNSGVCRSFRCLFDAVLGGGFGTDSNIVGIFKMN